MNFDNYVKAIDALAVAFGWAHQGNHYCDPSAWRPLYDDGLSPEEAWDEEVYAGVSMPG